MRKLSNITILILSIGLASTSVLARQVVDPADYVGYIHGAYKISLASTPILAQQAVDPTDYVGYTHGVYRISLAAVSIDINAASAPILAQQAVDPTDYVGYTHSAVAPVDLARSSHSIDDRESRRIGKLLWKNNHVQGGYGNVR